jgi:hypothetical protein
MKAGGGGGALTPMPQHLPVQALGPPKIRDCKYSFTRPTDHRHRFRVFACCRLDCAACLIITHWEDSLGIHQGPIMTHGMSDEPEF